MSSASSSSRQQLQQRVQKLRQQLQHRQARQKTTARSGAPVESDDYMSSASPLPPPRPPPLPPLRWRGSGGAEDAPAPTAAIARAQQRTRRLMRRHLCARRTPAAGNRSELQASLYRFLDGQQRKQQRKGAMLDSTYGAHRPQQQQQHRGIEKRHAQNFDDPADVYNSSASLEAKDQERRRILLQAIGRLRRLSASAIDSASNAAEAPKFEVEGNATVEDEPVDHKPEARRQPERQPTSAAASRSSGPRASRGENHYPSHQSAGGRPSQRQQQQQCQQKQRRPSEQASKHSLAATQQPSAAALREKLEQLDANLCHLALACRAGIGGVRGGCGGVELGGKIAEARQLVGSMQNREAKRQQRQKCRAAGDDSAAAAASTGEAGSHGCSNAWSSQDRRRCRGRGGGDSAEPPPLFWRCPAHAELACHAERGRRRPKSPSGKKPRKPNTAVQRVIDQSKAALAGDPVFHVSCAGSEFKWGQMTVPTIAIQSVPNAADRLGQANLHRHRLRERRLAALAEIDEFADRVQDKWEVMEEARIDRAIDEAYGRLRRALWTGKDGGRGQRRQGKGGGGSSGVGGSGVASSHCSAGAAGGADGKAEAGSAAEKTSAAEAAPTGTAVAKPD